MADSKSPEQEVKEWWSQWRAADYSWRGLARRRIQGLGTLQEYWRRDQAGEVRDDEAMKAAGELVETPDGALWHIVHLPEEIPDHGVTDKSDWANPIWAKIDALVSARLAAAGETVLGVRARVSGQDRRAQLDGAVLLNRPKLEDPARPLHVKAYRAMFLSGMDFDDAVFGKSASFDDSCFQSYAWFDSASFQGEARFAGVVFCAPSSFIKTKFAGEASFHNIKALNGLKMMRAVFDAPVAFTRASIKDHANFEGVAFSESVSFERMTFFDTADFDDAKFAKDATFDDVEFGGGAFFSGSSWQGAASFAKATFKDVGVFEKSRFSGGASFFETKFVGRLHMGNAELGGEVDFMRAKFDDLAYFRDVSFVGCKELSFQSARMAGPAIFEDTAWPIDANALGGAFADTVFQRLADFDGMKFAAFEAFDGADFNAEVRFSAYEKDTNLRVALKAVKAGARVMAAKRVADEIERRSRDGKDTKLSWFERRRIGNLKGARAELLTRLQNGFRTVKLAAETCRDRVAEQRFYRWELICRRKQRATPFPERIFSLLYAGVSNYGGSALLPMVFVLLAWLAFSGAYWAWSEALLGNPLSAFNGSQIPSGFYEAGKFSAGAIFRPFGFWVVTPSSGEWERAFLDGHGSGHGLFVRLVGSLQSLLGLILFFLTALAIRRRFQIN